MSIIVDGLEYESQINGAILVRNISNKNSRINISHIVDGMMVTAIGDRVFADNERLVEIGIPKTVREIGDFAFAGCVNLRKVREINCVMPTKYRGLKIQKQAFQGCNNLKSLELSSWIMLSGEQIFQRCHKLETIGVMGKNIVYGNVPKECFQACLSLEKITIEKPTCVIGSDAFDWCSSLKEITFKSHTVCSEDEKTWDSLRKCRIRCLNNSNIVDLGYDGFEIEVFEDK